jgi:acylaminoacyl-peptidase
MRNHAGRCAAILFILVQGQLASAQKAGGERLRLADLFRLEYASDPQIAPDGTRVVYVRNGFDIMKDRGRSSLWSVSVSGSDHRPFASGERKESSPRWSPDGKRVAYVAESDGAFQLRCRWLDGGQDGKLADLAASPGGLTWSPDGKDLAFTMLVEEKSKPFFELPPAPPGAKWADPPKIIRSVAFRFDGKGYLKEGFQHLSADGGAPRQVTKGSFHHDEAPVWTPDGQSLIFAANRRADWEHEPLASEIHELNLADGTVKTLTKGKGPHRQPASTRATRSAGSISSRATAAIVGCF